MTRFLAGARHTVWLVVRICLGVVLIARGWHRWQVTGLAYQEAYLRRTETPYADWAALGGTILEIAGGVFLILGAATPVVALVLLVEQVLIIAWTKWYRGLALNGPWGDGWEYTLITICLLLLLLVYGAGKVSVDQLFRGRKRHEDPYGYD